MKKKSALLMIDLQNDFCENGALAVPCADEVIPLANELQKKFDCVIATQDWHPHDHKSFAANHADKKIGEVITLGTNRQVLWPVHCVQNTRGAEFNPQLNLSRVNKIIYKGTDKEIDSYSAFFDNAHDRATGLEDYLNEKKIKTIYVMGLATDYCVLYSCLDALKLGFEVFIIEDACRGIDLNKGDIARALGEIEAMGGRRVRVKDIAN